MKWLCLNICMIFEYTFTYLDQMETNTLVYVQVLSWVQFACLML